VEQVFWDRPKRSTQEKIARAGNDKGTENYAAEKILLQKSKPSNLR
jgi:hypothetical protein